MLSAEGSHEAAVENEHNGVSIFKVGKADLVAAEIVQLKIRGWLVKFDFRHISFP